MSKKRVRSSQRQRRRVTESAPLDEFGFSAAHYHPRGRPKLHRFIGVSLGGGKTDKTCVAVIEYYPDQKKIFLSRLFDKIQTENEISADLQLHRLITQCPPPLESISFDVPLQLPKCITCRKRCPGYEACTEPEIIWMWKQHKASLKKKSPPKLFTPYTERCVEQYLQTELEEPFHLSHALGSNLAPLTARALFIRRRLKSVRALEAFPKLTLWRVGQALHVPKTHLRFHRHWEGGATSRQFILNKMMDKNLAFIYDQDVKVLVDSPQAFDSFLCALTGLLSFLGQCERRPKGFPKSESWVQIPKKSLVWP